MSKNSKLFFGVVAFCLFLPSAWAADQTPVNGVVKAIKLSAGKVTISHGPIKELGMGAIQ